MRVSLSRENALPTTVEDEPAQQSQTFKPSDSTEFDKPSEQRKVRAPQPQTHRYEVVRYDHYYVERPGNNPLQRVLSPLDEPLLYRDGWHAPCPAAQTEDPYHTVVVNESFDHAVELHCSQNCDQKDILSGLGLTAAVLSPVADPGGYKPRGGDSVRPFREIRRFRDVSGNLVYSQGLTAEGDRPVWRPNWRGEYDWGIKGVPQVLYRLPQVARAVETGVTVYITEGERDADAVVEAGGVATCNYGGAGQWSVEYNEHLSRADAVIIAHNNVAGYNHAHSVLAFVQPVAMCACIVAPAVGTNALDHLKAGYGLDDFVPVGVHGVGKDQRG